VTRSSAKLSFELLRINATCTGAFYMRISQQPQIQATANIFAAIINSSTAACG
jgi:hypothetical protein